MCVAAVRCCCAAEPLLQALIANAPPEELCELLGVCAGSLVARLSKAQLPFPDAEQRRRMPCAHKLARQLQVARLSAAPGVPQGALGDSCDMCKVRRWQLAGTAPALLGLSRPHRAEEQCAPCTCCRADVCARADGRD